MADTADEHEPDPKNDEETGNLGEEEQGEAEQEVKTFENPNVKKRLADSIGSGYMQLDLSRCKLLAVPEEAIEISSLRHLYLAHNSIELLPETFFHQLPNLEWLDIRNNELQSLANAASGLISHPSLRNLLVSSNKLTFLPPQLGKLVLHGI